MVSLDTFDALTYWTLWMTVIAMAAGAVVLYVEGRGMDGEGREHAVVTVFVPVVAATMYLAMALGFGVS